jgi:endonuclease-3
MASKAQLQRRAAEVLNRLRTLYPDARVELDFTTVLELAIGAILAAQCTDKRVNLTTPALFKKYRTAKAWAATKQETLEKEIHSTGFYRNKAKNIRALCKVLDEKFGGELPDDFDTLLTLPGIGRKTANVLMASGFNRPGMVVDTHMTRLANRLGLTKHADAVKIEFDLRDIVPEKDWSDFSQCIVWHGRRCCFARKPECARCPLNELCPSAEAPRR